MRGTQVRDADRGGCLSELELSLVGGSREWAERLRSLCVARVFLPNLRASGRDPR